MLDSVFIPSSFPSFVAFHPWLEPFSSSVLPIVVHTVHIFKKKKRKKKAWQCCWMSCFCALVNSVIDKWVCARACVCAELELLDFSFPSSSLLVLLFAANMATWATLSLKSLLKAQSLLLPSLESSQEVAATLAWDTMWPARRGSVCLPEQLWLDDV